MDTRPVAVPTKEPARPEERNALAAASSVPGADPWTKFARLMAQAYRYAPLFP